VILLTFGTGIGSALFVNGVLVPNTELGHLELNGHDAEKKASSKAKEDGELTWEHWAGRVQKYLAHVEMLFSPELFIIGGGVSRKADKFLHFIEDIKAEIVPAQLQNNAGIVGAAMHAAGDD
jgi:polyphosphate glucokinase